MTTDPIEAVARAGLIERLRTETVSVGPFKSCGKLSRQLIEERREAATFIEQQAARIAELEVEVARRVRNEARNCLNWGPCSQHDGHMPEPDTIGYVDDTGGAR